MKDPLLVENDSHWEFLVSGDVVTQCRFDYAVTILMTSNYGLTSEFRIENKFYFQTRELSYEIDPERLVVAPIISILHQTVIKAVAHKNGRLVLGFRNGSELTAYPNDSYEAWTFANDVGDRIVCMPSGELAIWTHNGYQ